MTDMPENPVVTNDKWLAALDKEGLRGDYKHMRPDYTVDQDWSAYSAEEHALYKRLYERQLKLLPKYACTEVIEGVTQLGASNTIPRLEEISNKLRKATGWELVGVPGLVPDLAFFKLLASKRFPVTIWLLKPEEFDYIVEPDVFHDCFGHVPLLFNPFFADYMQAYGQGGLKAKGLNALPMLSRLYWYTVEFGLIKTDQGLRAYGAGIMSSGGELVHCIDSPAPSREPFDLETVLSTDFHIDTYQEKYFVIDSFEDLMEKTAQDFTAIYARLRQMPIRQPSKKYG